MPESGRPHDISGLTASERKRTKRELQASLALVRTDSPARVPILAHLSAVDTKLAERGQAAEPRGDIVNLTPGRVRKVREYASLGIAQYWIVEHSPNPKVQVLTLGETATGLVLPWSPGPSWPRISRRRGYFPSRSTRRRCSSSDTVNSRAP